MEKPFVLFGPDHLAAIAIAFALPVALGLIARASGCTRLARGMAFGFAAELIGTWTLWYWQIAARGWLSPATILPMQLCDWAAIAALVALLSRGQRSYELAYFWALSGTVQALLTPDLYYGFPDVRFIVFFAFHDGAIASVLYLMIAFRMRPVPASIARVIAWSFGYFACAIAVNRLLHTNFGFLSAKPQMPSLLDYMGPWPFYDFALVGLGFLYIFLLYLPFFIADRLGGSAAR